MAGQLIAFPGVTIEPEPRKARRTKRQRYLDKLCEQTVAGAVGVEAEINVMLVRDWLVSLGPGAARWPIDYCDDALGSIRKLRRQLTGRTT
jgi:hypothetical protein